MPCFAKTTSRWIHEPMTHASPRVHLSKDARAPVSRGKPWLPATGGKTLRGSHLRPYPRREGSQLQCPVHASTQPLEAGNLGPPLDARTAPSKLTPPEATFAELVELFISTFSRSKHDQRAR